MARVVGYMGPRWGIEDAGGRFGCLAVGSGVEGLGVGVVRLEDAVRLEAMDDGALFFCRGNFFSGGDLLVLDRLLGGGELLGSDER